MVRQSPPLGLSALAACACLFVSSTVLAADFAPARSVSTGAAPTDPTAVASGDLNNDGAPDLVFANFATGNISVQLNDNDGLGNFTGTATQSAVGSGSGSPRDVVIGNVVGDANLDVVVAVSGDNVVTVLPGLGTGGFGTPFDLSTGTDPRSVTLGDVNNDGKLDIIVANFNPSGTGSITVWLRDDGALGPNPFSQALGSPFSTGGITKPFSVKFADATGDTIPDIVYTNFATGTVGVMQRDISGVLSGPVNYTVGTNPHGVAVGDAGGTADIDLVAANSGSANVSVLLGNGGGFAAAVNSAVGTSPRAVAILDIDDSTPDPDLLVVNAGSNNISVLPGDGTGSFPVAMAANNFAADTAPTSLAIDDYDGDGLPDVAVANEGAGSSNGTVLINDKKPVLGDDTYTVINGDANITLNVLANDSDPDGDTLTITAVSAGSAGGTIAINSGGASLDYSTPSPQVANGTVETFTYTAQDPYGYAVTANVAVTITSNSAPTDVALTPAAVDENAANNVVVGTLSTTDPDTGDTFTYSLLDNAGGRFVLGGASNDEIRVANGSLLDFETNTSHTISVQTTDSGGLSLASQKTLTITVNDVNEAPTAVGLSPAAVNENASTDTLVGTLSTTDPDSGDTHSYSFVAPNGSGGGAFKIVGGQILVDNGSLLDFESASSVDITVRTTDSGSLSFDQTLTISVNDVNEAPTAVALTPSAVDENSPNNTVVGTLSSTDPDAGSSFTYSFVAPNNDAGGAFKIVSDQIQVANGSLLDFESASSLNVTVRTTDNGSLTFDQALTISINNVNEPPTAVGSIGPQSGTGGVAFGPLNVSGNFSDPDSSLNYSLSGLPAGSGLVINASTGVLSGTLTDADAQASPITVSVNASDGSASASQQFALTVVAGNAAPSASSGGIILFQGASATVQVNASDPNAGDTLSYAVSQQPATVGGSASVDGNGLVTYDATGALAGSDSIQVTVSDDGTPSRSTTVTIPLTVNASGETDSNGDGLTDAQAIALGLDPNVANGDTDSDGIPDANEVGDPNNPTDSDNDSVIDALEAGGTAGDASTANGVRLSNGGAQVQIVSAGQVLSAVTVGAANGGPEGVNFPFGTVGYTTTSAVGGSVTVRFTFSTALPAEPRVFKVDGSGNYVALPSSLWTRVNDTTLDVTVTDGDSTTDQDGMANGLIVDPLAVGSVASSGGGGGGCSLVAAADGRRDPLLPALLLTAIGFLARRRRKGF